VKLSSSQCSCGHVLCSAHQSSWVAQVDVASTVQKILFEVLKVFVFLCQAEIKHKYIWSDSL